MKLKTAIFTMGIITTQSYLLANCSCDCTDTSSTAKILTEDKVILKTEEKRELNLLKNKKETLLLNVKDSKCGLAYVSNNKIIFEADSRDCQEKLYYEIEDKYGNIIKKKVDISVIDVNKYKNETLKNYKSQTQITEQKKKYVTPDTSYSTKTYTKNHSSAKTQPQITEQKKKYVTPDTSYNTKAHTKNYSSVKTQPQVTEQKKKYITPDTSYNTKTYTKNYSSAKTQTQITEQKKKYITPDTSYSTKAQTKNYSSVKTQTQITAQKKKYITPDTSYNTHTTQKKSLKNKADKNSRLTTNCNSSCISYSSKRSHKHKYQHKKRAHFRIKGHKHTTVNNCSSVCNNSCTQED